MSEDERPDNFEFTKVLGEWLTKVQDAERAAIEECAERILLSGTNWGIEVFHFHEGDKITVIAEPVPYTPHIVYHDTVYGPPPEGDEIRHWVPCAAKGCKAGMVGGQTGFNYDYPWPCSTCDGKGWVVGGAATS